GRCRFARCHSRYRQHGRAGIAVMEMVAWRGAVIVGRAASLRGELTGIAVSNTAIGDGVNVDNIKACFDIFVDMKYDGVVSLECEGQGGPMIEKSLTFVRDLVDDANKRIAAA
ncbi:MAG: hypothetical protein V3R33_00845, partial [Anaerolineales bacterium]